MKRGRNKGLETHGGPEVLDFEEDVDDAAVANERHDPEEEENDAEEVADEWVDRRELGPVRVDDGHHVVWSHNCQSYTCCHF